MSPEEIEELLSPEHAVKAAMQGDYGPAVRLAIGVLHQKQVQDEKDFVRAVVLDIIRCSTGHEATLSDMSHKEFAVWVCDRADAILGELNKRALEHNLKKP